MSASARESQAPYYRPYRWAVAQFQLGLRPFTPDRWISMETDYAANMREKRDRLAAYPDRYYRALPSSLPAQRELRQRIVAHLLKDHAQRFIRTGDLVTSADSNRAFDLEDSSIEPLLQLSQFIEEDFMLIEEVEGSALITAASNVYSSSGRLVASVGRAIDWAHIPVPGLSEMLGRRIDRIVGSVHATTPAERFNWQLTPMASIFFPRDDPHAANAAAMHAILETLRAEPQRAGELLWIRVERQTLSRLPESGAVAFSLHTYSDPLSSIKADAESLRAMLALLRAYSPERLKYSEMDIILEPVITWLEMASSTPSR
jgi:dimethylamine monooxygenase subunit A